MARAGLLGPGTGPRPRGIAVLGVVLLLAVQLPESTGTSIASRQVVVEEDEPEEPRALPVASQTTLTVTDRPSTVLATSPSVSRLSTTLAPDFPSPTNSNINHGTKSKRSLDQDDEDDNDEDDGDDEVDDDDDDNEDFDDFDSDEEDEDEFGSSSEEDDDEDDEAAENEKEPDVEAELGALPRGVLASSKGRFPSRSPVHPGDDKMNLELDSNASKPGYYEEFAQQLHPRRGEQPDRKKQKYEGQRESSVQKGLPKLSQRQKQLFYDRSADLLRDYLVGAGNELPNPEDSTNLEDSLAPFLDSPFTSTRAENDLSSDLDTVDAEVDLESNGEEDKDAKVLRRLRSKRVQRDAELLSELKDQLADDLLLEELDDKLRDIEEIESRLPARRLCRMYNRMIKLQRIDPKLANDTYFKFLPLMRERGCVPLDSPLRSPGSSSKGSEISPTEGPLTIPRKPALKEHKNKKKKKKKKRKRKKLRPGETRPSERSTTPTPRGQPERVVAESLGETTRLHHHSGQQQRESPLLDEKLRALNSERRELMLKAAREFGNSEPSGMRYNGEQLAHSPVEYKSEEVYTGIGRPYDTGRFGQFPATVFPEEFTRDYQYHQKNYKSSSRDWTSPSWSSRDRLYYPKYSSPRTHSKQAPTHWNQLTRDWPRFLKTYLNHDLEKVRPILKNLSIWDEKNVSPNTRPGHRFSDFWISPKEKDEFPEVSQDLTGSQQGSEEPVPQLTMTSWNSLTSDPATWPFKLPGAKPWPKDENGKAYNPNADLVRKLGLYKNNESLGKHKPTTKHPSKLNSEMTHTTARSLSQSRVNSFFDSIEGGSWAQNEDEQLRRWNDPINRKNWSQKLPDDWTADKTPTTLSTWPNKWKNFAYHKVTVVPTQTGSKLDSMKQNKNAFIAVSDVSAQKYSDWRKNDIEEMPYKLDNFNTLNEPTDFDSQKSRFSKKSSMKNAPPMAELYGTTDLLESQLEGLRNNVLLDVEIKMTNSTNHDSQKSSHSFEKNFTHTGMDKNATNFAQQER